MYIITAKLTAKPECKGELLVLAQDLIKQSREEQGCMSYSGYVDQMQENALLFLEEWSDRQAIDRHFETPHFKNFVSRITHLISDQPVIHIHEVAATQTP